MTVSVVSLGPGDPELVTLGAWRTLRRSDAVYCPATRTAEGAWRSRAGAVLAAIGIDPGRIRHFELPMTPDGVRAREVYAAVAGEIAGRCGRERVAVAAEGDAGIYSSVHYVGDALLARGIGVRYEAGIPALIAAGAVAGLHVVSGKEPLVLLPRAERPGQLLDPLRAGCTVAVMKLSQCADTLREAIRRSPEAAWHYFENVGTAQELHLTDTERILSREFPYFSLLIVRPGRDR